MAGPRNAVRSISRFRTLVVRRTFAAPYLRRMASRRRGSIPTEKNRWTSSTRVAKSGTR